MCRSGDWDQSCRGNAASFESLAMAGAALSLSRGRRVGEPFIRTSRD